MPIALAVMHWDERMGGEIIGVYPQGTEINPKTLIQIFSQHEFTGESGFVSMNVGPRNLGSYYTGPETALYLLIVLADTEEADEYEEGLADAAHQVLLNYDDESFNVLLPSIFQRLSLYPKLTEEQHLAYLYSSEAKRLILNRLRDEGMIYKTETAVWLKERFMGGYIEIDPIINDLIKAGIAKMASVKGVAADLLFFMNDIMVSRVPCRKIFQNPIEANLPKTLIISYERMVKNFFKTYYPTEEDSVKIIDEVILDPEGYEVLKLLRKTILTENELHKLYQRKIEDPQALMKKLTDLNVIATLKDEKGHLYYALIADFHIHKFFPKYMLNMIRNDYRTRRQSTTTLMAALDMMEVEYYNFLKLAEMKKQQPAKKEEEPLEIELVTE